MKFSFLVFNGYEHYLESWGFLSFMIRALVASDGVPEFAKQKWKNSCCSPHACWSQQQISRLTNEKLILNSPWVDFNTDQFYSSLKGLEDQWDILHISRLQRKHDLADCQKTKDTACTVLHEWQTYLASESGRLWRCCCWGKAIPIKRGHCPCWLHGPQHHLTTCLSVFLWASSGLCSLISELESPTSAMSIFRWCSTESMQEAQVWRESRGWTGLVIIESKWFLTARGTPFNGTCFPTLGQWYHRRNKAIYHGQLPYHPAH